MLKLVIAHHSIGLLAALWSMHLDREGFNPLATLFAVIIGPFALLGVAYRKGGAAALLWILVILMMGIAGNFE